MSVNVAEILEIEEPEFPEEPRVAPLPLARHPAASRFELKFLVTLAEGEKIVNELRHNMVFDSHTDSTGRYAVHSLYLDTGDRKDYYDVINGEKNRCKFRFRHYGGAPSCIALEAKKKTNQTISKTRAWIEPDEMESLWNAPFAASGDFGFFAYHFARYNYKPLVSLSYERAALVDLLGHDVRVTLDFNLRCAGPESFMPPFGESGARVLPPGYGILEVKFDARMPQWLRSCLRKNRLVARPYSKYVKSVDRYVYNQPLLEELNQSWMNF